MSPRAASRFRISCFHGETSNAAIEQPLPAIDIASALTTFDKDKQQEYVKGLKALRSAQKKMFPNSAKFSELSSEQQVAVLNIRMAKNGEIKSA